VGHDAIQQQALTPIKDNRMTLRQDLTLKSVAMCASLGWY
jgi:hypothetical protein